MEGGVGRWRGRRSGDEEGDDVGVGRMEKEEGGCRQKRLEGDKDQSKSV